MKNALRRKIQDKMYMIVCVWTRQHEIASFPRDVSDNIISQFADNEIRFDCFMPQLISISDSGKKLESIPNDQVNQPLLVTSSLGFGDQGIHAFSVKYIDGEHPGIGLHFFLLKKLSFCGGVLCI